MYSDRYGPLRFTLSDDTERLLNLPYRLHRWAGTGRYDSDVCFSVRYPSAYEAERSPQSVEQAEAAMSKYERLLFPHGRAHVEADCWVAFVPYEGSKHYRAVINGTELTGYVERSEALRGRMQRLGLGDQACLAAAKIRGGGLMPDGRRRAYFVAVDMKRFPGRALQHEVVRRRRRGNLSGSKERWTRHLATARAQGLH